MSNWILDPTTLPGFKSLKRVPRHNTIVQDIDSGKEGRVQKWLTQRYRYELEFEMLRSSPSWQELQAVTSLFARHAGKRDNFLLKDPEDNAVSGHGFGVGDGATTAFQLQRTLGGTFSDVLGSWPAYDKPRTNLLLQSRAFDNVIWAKNGTASVSANTAIAPDGSATADTVNVPAANDNVQQEALGSGFTVGSTWSFSCWLLGTAGQTISISLGSLAGTFEQTVTNVTLAGVWQRVSAILTIANAGHTALLATITNAGLPTPATSCFAWGAQLEVGAMVTQYIPTTAAAATIIPLYWPSYGDGFEPITEPNFLTVAISKDGVLQTPVSAWTPGANGIVTFAAAPAAGAALSWSGSYFRRVRLDDDEPVFTRVLPYSSSGGPIYKASIDLVSVV